MRQFIGLLQGAGEQEQVPAAGDPEGGEGPGIREGILQEELQVSHFQVDPEGVEGPGHREGVLQEELQVSHF